MNLRIGDIVNIRNDLEHARYGGFPARPELQLKKKGITGAIEEIRTVKVGEDKEILVYKVKGTNAFFSKSMFSNENYVKKPISLKVVGDNIVFMDRKGVQLLLKKTQANLMYSVIKAIEKKADILIEETEIGNIYMNKTSRYEVFTDFNKKTLEILEDDIPKYREFLKEL